MAQGRAGIGVGGVEGVVAALAVDLADRMDRRQVHHVETHGRNRGEPLGSGGEGAGARRVHAGALAAGKNSYHDPNNARVRSTRNGHPGDSAGKSRSGCSVSSSVTSEASATARRASPGRRVSRRASALLVSSSWACRDPGGQIVGHTFQNPRAFFQLQVDVDPRGDLHRGPTAPSVGGVMPGVDRERPVPGYAEPEAPPPAVEPPPAGAGGTRCSSPCGSHRTTSAPSAS